MSADISIHAPAKGATRLTKQSQQRLTISIHAPAKGATGPVWGTPDIKRHFNPRSREGSDASQASQSAKEHISIHAPAKGATYITKDMCAVTKGFQSTLPRRERLANNKINSNAGDFNPRSREGSDEKYYYSLPLPGISIHAPAKGATVTSATAFVVTVNFNPRSREGSDKLPCIFATCVALFQSTLPRRERLQPRAIISLSANFNPRSREGSDSKNKQIHSKNSYPFCLFFPCDTIYLLFYPIQSQIRTIFSKLSGANPFGVLCLLAVRTKGFIEIKALSCPRFLSRRYAPPYFCSYYPDSRTADCLS